MGRKKLMAIWSFLIAALVFLTPLSIFSFYVSDYEYIKVDGQPRSYLVRFPDDYGDEPLPLVLVLHGGGSDAKIMESITGFTALAEKEDFIVVYPNGRGFLQYFVLTWNAGYCCYYAYDNNIDDIVFIDKLLDHLEGTYNVDSNRTYIVGHSNGAMMAYRLAAELSPRISAVAAVSGTVGGKTTAKSDLWINQPPQGAVSVIHFHGTADTIIPYEGGHGVDAFGTRVDLSVNETIHFWVDNNNCSSVPEITVRENSICFQYGNGINETEVILYSITNGTHSWSKSELSVSDGRTLSVSEIIWEFFENHSKTTSRSG